MDDSALPSQPHPIRENVDALCPHVRCENAARGRMSAAGGAQAGTARRRAIVHAADTLARHRHRRDKEAA